MEINRESLANEHWMFALKLYQKRFGRTRRPMVRERLYDATVDTFLRTVKIWDGRIPFRPFLVYCLRHAWGNVFRNDRIKYVPLGKNVAWVNSNLFRVDNEDFFSRGMERMSPQQREALGLYREGHTPTEVAARSGTTKQAGHYTWNKVVAKLREVIGD